jgi:hypothetical protein
LKPDLAGELGPQVHDPICLRLGLKNLGIYRPHRPHRPWLLNCRLSRARYKA